MYATILWILAVSTPGPPLVAALRVPVHGRRSRYRTITVNDGHRARADVTNRWACAWLMFPQRPWRNDDGLYADTCTGLSVADPTDIAGGKVEFSGNSTPRGYYARNVLQPTVENTRKSNGNPYVSSETTIGRSVNRDHPAVTVVDVLGTYAASVEMVDFHQYRLRSSKYFVIYRFSTFVNGSRRAHTSRFSYLWPYPGNLRDTKMSRSQNVIKNNDGRFSNFLDELLSLLCLTSMCPCDACTQYYCMVDGDDDEWQGPCLVDNYGIHYSNTIYNIYEHCKSAQTQCYFS